MTARVQVERLGGTALMVVPPVPVRSWQRSVKHLIDRIGAGLLLVAGAPLMFLIALAVRLESPGPVLYRQRRVGLDGREFEMLKFRTMVGGPETWGEADAAWLSSLLGTAPPPAGPDRRTRIGRILRRSSLDELPQLWNVLKGEMSLVGPRPERVWVAEGLEQVVDRYGDRHRVRCGITGWAQVHDLRGTTSLADRTEWDNYYIENWSLALDLKILLLTVPAMLRGRSAE
jgi:lipopolysaccharide/colanic/teichoic acid biosynthesis glycosyltransferase